jgi:hypothetical protein
LKNKPSKIPAWKQVENVGWLSMDYTESYPSSTIHDRRRENPILYTKIYMRFWGHIER